MRRLGTADLRPGSSLEGKRVHRARGCLAGLGTSCRGTAGPPAAPMCPLRRAPWVGWAPASWRLRERQTDRRMERRMDSGQGTGGWHTDGYPPLRGARGLCSAGDGGVAMGCCPPPFCAVEMGDGSLGFSVLWGQGMAVRSFAPKALHPKPSTSSILVQSTQLACHGATVLKGTH